MAKLMVDLTPLYDRKITGVEIYGIEFYEALLKTRHQIIPIFRKSNTIDSNPNSLIIPYKNRLYVENYILPKIIRKSDADAIFFPIFPPPFFSYKGNAQIIPTIHDLAFRKYANTLSYKARLYLTPKYNRALRKASKIITISNTVMQELDEITDIKVFNLGNNISKDYRRCNLSYREDTLKRFGLLPTKYIISVSTVEPRKNLSFLLMIWSQIKNEFKDFKLVLTGRYGWGKDKILDNLLGQCLDSVVLTDYVTQSELKDLYHFSNSFVLLSKYEGFGRTPLEAYACGTNVVVSDIPVFREVMTPVTQNFVPLNNIDLGVSILRDVISNKKLFDDNIKEEIISDYIGVLENNITNQIDKVLI